MHSALRQLARFSVYLIKSIELRMRCLCQWDHRGPGRLWYPTGHGARDMNDWHQERIMSEPYGEDQFKTSVFLVFCNRVAAIMSPAGDSRL